MDLDIISKGKKWIGCATILGATSIAILLWLGVSGPAASCGDSGPAPTIAFQLAHSAADLTSIFGAESSACRAALIEGLKSGGQADLFLFIPIYALFLGGFIIATASPSKSLSRFLAIALAVTVVGDALETYSQLRILDNIDAGAAFLRSLTLGNGLKTVGLGLLLMGIALNLWRQGGRGDRFAASVLALTAVLRFTAFAVESIRPLGPLTALAAFAVIFLYCVWRYRRTRQ